MGQSKSSKQRSPGGSKYSTDYSGWWRRDINTSPAHLPHTQMQISTLGTSCLPVKNTTPSALSMTHTHTGACAMRKGEESDFDRWGKLPGGARTTAAAAAAAVCTRVLVCVGLRMTEDCIHYADWDVYKTPSPRTHTHTSPPLTLWVCGEERSATVSYSFVLSARQSCLINWILNKARQNTSSPKFLLSPGVCARTWKCVCRYNFTYSLLDVCMCIKISSAGFPSLFHLSVHPFFSFSCDCVQNTNNMTKICRKQQGCDFLHKRNDKLGYSAQTRLFPVIKCSAWELMNTYWQ